VIVPASVIISPQLFASLGRLSANEQAKVIEFINTFQGNPAHPSLSLERATRARSKGVWSGRVSSDLRAILYKDGDTWAILYADHHDAAYSWTERREIGRHSVTGALQIVEAVETVREIEKVVEVLRKPETEPLFKDHGDAYLLSLGVPETWLPTIRSVRDEDQLLIVCEKLPEDISERLIALAAGEFVTPPEPVAPERPALEAADTRRRFFVVDDAEELAAALAAPMDRWVAFLHPSQRSLVTRDFKGPAKVTGSAGTGKTVVAMHRARHLARRGERVLLTSFVSTLCDNIQRNLVKLCTGAQTGVGPRSSDRAQSAARIGGRDQQPSRDAASASCAHIRRWVYSCRMGQCRSVTGHRVVG
jgi:mRNA-degrading endonuclease RelE of RelBE toxin-antitoxin system